MGGCGVARKVGGAGRAVGPIKKKATPMAGRGAGCPAGQEVPSGPLSQFWQRERMGKARGCPQGARCRKRKGNGDARCAPARQGWAGAAATSVKVMEMQVGRRPVYGGAPRHPPKIAANATTRGV